MYKQQRKLSQVKCQNKREKCETREREREITREGNIPKKLRNGCKMIMKVISLSSLVHTPTALFLSLCLQLYSFRFGTLCATKLKDENDLTHNSKKKLSFLFLIVFQNLLFCLFFLFLNYLNNEICFGN